VQSKLSNILHANELAGDLRYVFLRLMLDYDMVWPDNLNGDPLSDEGSNEDGSDHEDANGHCPDPGVQGGSAVQDVGPAVGGSVAGSTGADGGFDMQYGGPADGGPAIQSKLALEVGGPAVVGIIGVHVHCSVMYRIVGVPL